MKKLIVVLLFVSALYTNAQYVFEAKGVVNTKISSNLPKDANVELVGLIKDPTRNRYQAVLVSDVIREVVNLDILDNISFEYSNPEEFWRIQATKNSVYDNILENGFQYKLRKELQDEIQEYIKYIQNNDLFFEDSYLEDYLYTLVFKILPERIKDDRPGAISIKIIKDIVPNAWIFSNGTLFITTGMLSTITSEEELIGVLSHEIAHFVLDHSIINFNKAAQRQKRTEFWALLATGVAAAADLYIATNNEYYDPGAITIGTAILSTSIAEAVIERLGLKYTREQELAADKSAVELMNYIKIDHRALATALKKIEAYCILTGDYLALTGEGTHPAINVRISKIGQPATFTDSHYDKKMSFVNYFNAALQYNCNNYEACITLLNRNINANVATEEDYILMAIVTMVLYDTKEKNLEALGYINKAKLLNICPTFNQSKQEAIVLLRLERKDEAKNSLIEYRTIIEKEITNIERNYYGEIQKMHIGNYLNGEYEWTLKMINKIKNM